MRSLLFATGLFSLVMIAACDQAADAQQKADAAQTEANQKSAKARDEADKKVVSAQTEADTKIAEAQAGFSKLREDYRHKTTVALADLDKSIVGLQGNAERAVGNAKEGLDANLKQIHVARDAFVTNYRSIETASAATWDNNKAQLDNEWTQLKALVDRN